MFGLRTKKRKLKLSDKLIDILDKHYACDYQVSKLEKLLNATEIKTLISCVKIELVFRVYYCSIELFDGIRKREYYLKLDSDGNVWTNYYINVGGRSFVDCEKLKQLFIQEITKSLC